MQEALKVAARARRFYTAKPMIRLLQAPTLAGYREQDTEHRNVEQMDLCCLAADALRATSAK